MNVYDFDGTIYTNDSTLKFYIFCLKRNPALLLCAIRQCFAIFLYLANIYSKTKAKEEFFCFLKYIKNVDQVIDDFWRIEYKNIQPWYLSQKASDDVIISASPEFLILPIAGKLGNLEVIGSKIDKTTGKYLGSNCFGAEKVRRFKEIYPNSTIENFYSDSISDCPMAQISKNAFFVQSGKIVAWNHLSTMNTGRTSGLEILRYGFWGVITTCLNLFVFQLFLNLQVNYIVANIVSYFIAVAFSYFFNALFVFDQISSVNFFQMVKFILIRLVSIAIDSILLFIVVETLQFNIFISKVSISFIIILGTYLVNRKYVFNNHKEKRN